MDNLELLTRSFEDDLILLDDKVNELEELFKLIGIIQVVQSLILIILSIFVLWGVI